MKLSLRRALLWLSRQSWLPTLGTIVTLLVAGAIGAAPILLAPSTGWRWAAVVLSPSLGFAVVVGITEAVHRVRQLMVRHDLLPPPPPRPPEPPDEELDLRNFPDRNEGDRTAAPRGTAPLPFVSR